MIRFFQMIEGASVAKTKKTAKKKTVTARKKVTTDRKSTKAKNKPTTKTARGKAGAKKKSPVRAKAASAAKPSSRAKSARSKQGEPKGTVTVDRRTNDNRRNSDDRREKNVPVAVDGRKLQRREKVNRRRQIDPTTCERDYTDAEVEFMNCLEEYKRSSGRMFPTCSEILEVLQGLGYEKRSPDSAEPAMQASPETESKSEAAPDNSVGSDPAGIPDVTPPMVALGSPSVEMSPLGQ